MISAGCICLFLISCQSSPQRITIGFTGDILLDRGVRMQMDREGKESFFQSIQSQIPPFDYLIGNLECPVTEINNPVHKQFVFRGDTSNLPYLKQLGFTHFTLANNHAYDQGRSGLIATAEGLSAHQITPLGFGEMLESACEPIMIEAEGSTIVLLASVFLPLENWMPLSQSANVCQADYRELGEKIREIKNDDPDAVIIVNLHWGIEHIPEASPDQINKARYLIEQGADLIIGHHPHVIQPKEVFKGKEIYYSLGNFIFDQHQELNRRALMVKVAIQGREIKTEEIYYEIRDCKPELKN